MAELAGGEPLHLAQETGEVEGILEAAALGNFGDGEAGGGEESGTVVDADLPEIAPGSDVVLAAEKADEVLRGDGGELRGFFEAVFLGAMFVEVTAGAFAGAFAAGFVGAAGGYAEVFLQQGEGEGGEHFLAAFFAPGAEAEGGFHEELEGLRLGQDGGQTGEAAAQGERDEVGADGAPGVVSAVAAGEVEVFAAAGHEERDGAGRDEEALGVDGDVGLAEMDDDELVVGLDAGAALAAGFVPDVAENDAGGAAGVVYRRYVFAQRRHWLKVERKRLFVDIGMAGTQSFPNGV